MGTQLNKEASQSGKFYKEAIYSFGTLLIERFVRVHLYSDLLFSLSSIGRRQKKYLTTIHSFTEKVIKDRKSNIVKLNTNGMKDDVTESIYMHNKRRTAMLDLLITAEKEGLIDEVGIKEEVDTFMFEVRTYLSH